MKLARVVGTVVSTINVPVYEDRTLLLCDLVDPAGQPTGGYMIAVDVVGAGAGETVLLIDEGNSARQVLGLQVAPVRTLVVGIVDAVTLEEPTRPPGATPPPGASVPAPGQPVAPAGDKPTKEHRRRTRRSAT